MTWSKWEPRFNHYVRTCGPWTLHAHFQYAVLVHANGLEIQSDLTAARDEKAFAMRWARRVFKTFQEEQ